MMQIDASSGHCASPLHFVCVVVLRKIRRYRVGTSRRLAPTQCLVTFFYFSSELKKTRINSVETLKAKTSEVLNEATQEVSQRCLWKIRTKRCKDHQGKYIESVKVSNMMNTIFSGSRSGYLTATYSTLLHNIRTYVTFSEKC